MSSSTGTAYTSTTVIAPKDGGIDNLITGISVGDVQNGWINESSGQTPLINSLRKTLEHDMEWLDNESSESMYTQTTSDYVAQDCINALATPNLTYGFELSTIRWIHTIPASEFFWPTFVIAFNALCKMLCSIWNSPIQS